jgi:hypothetical protein
MKWPPLFFRIRIIEKGEKRIGLWFPVVLIWILFLPLLLLAFIITLLIDLMTFFQLRLTRALAGILAVTTELKGTIVNIDSRKDDSQLQITIL